jgi:hypothetical protein
MNNLIHGFIAIVGAPLVGTLKTIVGSPKLANKILHGPEAFIGKASNVEDVVCLPRTISNAAYESLRIAPWVKFDEIKNESVFLLRNL